MDKIIHEVQHYWRDHKRVVIAAGVILVIAIII
jgi:hypothetical protein